MEVEIVNSVHVKQKRELATPWQRIASSPTQVHGMMLHCRLPLWPTLQQR